MVDFAFTAQKLKTRDRLGKATEPSYAGACGRLVSNQS